MAKNVNLLATAQPDGSWSINGRSRDGARRLTSAALPGAVAVRAHLRHRGVDYLASTAKLYYLDGGTPVEIGAVAQAPTLVSFAGLVVVLDGQVAKAVDPDDGFHYGVLHDVSGHLWDHAGDVNAGSWALHAGGTTRAGVRFTAPTFGPGSVPLAVARLWLSKTGSPTGTATVKVFAANGGTLLGSGGIDVASLGATASYQAINITPQTGATCAVAGGESCYVVIEYTGGGASNCPRLHYATVAFGGGAVTHAGTWTADGAKNPLMAVGYGLAPAATCGVALGDRLRLGGLGGKAHYSGMADPNDWGGSVYNGAGAGWIGIERKSGGEINAMVAIYNEVFISKSGDERSIHRWTGSTPGKDGDMAVACVLANEGAVGRTMAETGNNVLFLDFGAVLGVEGVEGHGDVRKHPKSNDIANLIAAHGDSAAFGVYDRGNDAYWLQLAGLDYTLVLHVLTGQWTRYDWAGFRPTCFSHHDGRTYIGSAAGHLYCMDPTIHGRDGVASDDVGQPWACEVWGAMLDMGDRARAKQIKSLSYYLSSRTGCRGQILIKRDDGKAIDERITKSVAVPMNDDVLLGELELLLSDWTAPLGGGGGRLTVQRAGWIVKNIQVGMVAWPAGAPLYFGPVTLRVAILGDK